jgi:uncharacterized protein YjiS (DUF1127 family)
MFIASFIRYWRMHRAFRATMDQLSSLDDRTLADINVPRGEIQSVARRAARQAVV